MILTIATLSGCRRDIYGCTDPSAYNYNPNANVNNGTCVGIIYGCTDPNASNYNPNANTSSGTCTYTGNVTFWFGSNMPNATVTINGQSATITQYYPSGAPSCNAVGCANFTLPVGTYSYKATSSLYTWGYSNTLYATVTANGCATYELQ